MGLTKAVLKRPVTTVLVILCLIVFGLMSVFSSKMELMPAMDMPMMVIAAVYPGASPDDERLKYQNDHAGANETSIVMAVRPELVDFGQVKEDESNLIGIAGRHPVRESSEAFGNEILEYTMKTLIAGIEKEYKTIKER